MKPERVTDNKSRQFAKESEPVKKKRINSYEKLIGIDYRNVYKFFKDINKI